MTLANADMPALPWPYVLALCAALGGAIIALWRRDEKREERAQARAEEREKILETRLGEVTEAFRDLAEVKK